MLEIMIEQYLQELGPGLPMSPAPQKQATCQRRAGLHTYLYVLAEHRRWCPRETEIIDEPPPPWACPPSTEAEMWEHFHQPHH